MRTKKGGRIVLVTLFALLFLSSIALAVDCPLPDTGQTKCYNLTGEITCPQPGEDFYGQDAQYPCNPQSYTKLDANGDDLPDNETEWVMVRDNVTGLIWENKTDDGSIHDKDNTYDWDFAQVDFIIATLNLQGFGGYNDWRLPTIKELSFIVDSSLVDPTINTDYFSNTVSSYYWSSTTSAWLPYVAWIVDFGSGYVYCGRKPDGYYVRAVRGGQCREVDNFIDNGNGTVTDTDTSLMWQKAANLGGAYTWQQALFYCENLILNNDGEWTNATPNASGVKYDDWRLPNRNELQSLVDYERYKPSIDPIFNLDLGSNLDWSSTTYADDPLSAWGVTFYYGFVNGYNKSGYPCLMRAVRGGLTESSTTTTTISASTTTTITGSTTTTVQPCPTEQIYGEYSEPTELLRYLRDNVLSITPEGQEIIRLYYEWSLVIVEVMNEDEGFKAQVKEMIDGIVNVFGKRKILGE